jgi:hypothetical protein
LNPKCSKCACCAKFCAYIIATLGTLLIVGVLVRVMMDYTRPAPPTEDRAQLRRKNLQDLRNANAEVLNTPNYVWQDQAKGVVRMPIKDAMELSLKLWQDKDAARSNLFARTKIAFAVPPKAPEKPSQFE